MKASLLVEVHEWRGIKIERDLFMRVYRLGWVTIAASRFLVTDKLREFVVELRKALGR